MITSYSRPDTLDEALERLTAPDTTPLAGGTWLVGHQTGRDIEAVDLQSLPLRGVAADGGVLSIGAMTTLQELVDASGVPATIADLARREAPRSIRNAGTVGGTVALADPESELLAGLLAHGTTVEVTRPDSPQGIPLDELLGDGSLLAGGLITKVTVPTIGRSAADRTGRTPSDRPIVAAVAHRDHDGIRLALAGVAMRPVLVDPDAIDDLDPPSDFRGSPAYRRELAGVLAARVLRAVEVQR